MGIVLIHQRLVPTLLAAALLLCTVPCIAAASMDDDEALQRLRGEIADVESRIRSLENQRAGFLQDLEHLDLQLERQRRHLARLQREGELNRGELDRLREEEGELEARLERDRRKLAQQMAGLYRMGRMNYLRLFLSADSAAVMRERLRYLSYLSGRDSRLIDSCLETLDQLEQRQAELAESEASLAQITAEEERRQQSSLRLRRDKTRVLRRLETRIETQQQITAGLESSARGLEELIETLRQGVTVPLEVRAGLLPGLDYHRGLLPWPAAGRLVGRFGRKRHPRFGTTTISNGILLELSAGSPAAAVYFGTVVYDDWLHGYGNLVIVNHGGESYSLYAHLDRSAVEMGDWLNKGDLLGYSGSSGSLSGPALYFELRIGSEPVDPLKWLERR